MDSHVKDEGDQPSQVKKQQQHPSEEEEEEDDDEPPRLIREIAFLGPSSSSSAADPASASVGSGPSSAAASAAVEKEHLFDKVVTPSDVGKLNRLVIPKQHAERHFPLDPSARDKGLLLGFEDRNGKQWRFRYSYWNSSQSYVMTKGWSRFVKEKRLNFGDTVSFFRGTGPEAARDRLFIDWRRRVDARDPPRFPPFLSSSPWRPPGLLLPSQAMPATLYEHNLQAQRQYFRFNAMPTALNLGSRPIFFSYGKPSMPAPVPARVPVVLESVPLVHGPANTKAKRLRLFGVNLSCGESSGAPSSSNAQPRPAVRLLDLPPPAHQGGPGAGSSKQAALPSPSSTSSSSSKNEQRSQDLA